MNILQASIHTIWASLVALGWVKVILGVFIISFLSRIQYVLGFVAAVLFVAYLAHWI